VLNADGLSPRDRGRLDKALDRRFSFWLDGIMSLRLWLYIHEAELTHKSRHERKYATKKRRGCYAELKRPKTEYTVWAGDQNGVQIAKIVWDVLDLPVKVY
jgi:hypothetical protein